MKWLIDLALGLLGVWMGQKSDVAKEAGRNEAKSEIAEKAVRDVDTARKDKEKADAQVRATDYHDRVDRL